MRTMIETKWPAPFDTAAADRLLERFAALGRSEARFASREESTAMLRCIGGNSPYLSDLAQKEAATLARFVAEGPDATIAAAMEALAQVRPAAKRETVAAAMRVAKRQVALTCAL